MELEELKMLWTTQDEKLNKSLQLNMQLLRRINFDKAGDKLRTLLFYKIAELIILLFMVVYLWNFTIINIHYPGFYIPSVIITAFITTGIVSDIRQLVLIIQLRSEQDVPVALLQKKVERLKLLIINYVKTSFITIPFFPLLLIVGGKIIFNANCWLPQYRVFLISNFIIGLLLAPVFIWFYRQLGKQSIKQIWVKGFLSGSGWDQARLAQQFLAEIEAFEKE